MTLVSPRSRAAIAVLAACLLAIVANCLAAEPLAVGPLGDEPEATAVDKKFPEIAQAAELFGKRRFDDALTKLQEACQKHPELPPAQIIMFGFFDQVRRAGATGAAVAARTSLEKAVIDSPTDPEAFVILGNIALSERRVTESELLFGKASQLMAGFQGDADRKKALQQKVLGGLASVALAREDWTGAETQLLELLKLNDKNVPAMQQLARALFKQGTKPKTVACSDWTKTAYETDPKRALPAPTQMALFYAQAPDFDNAKKWIDYSLTAYPKDLRARLAAAQWYWQTSELEMKINPVHLDAAEKHAAEAMIIDPESIDAIVFRGVVALFKKDFASAERWFEKAHIMKFDHFPAKNNLALALCEQDDSSKRQRALQLADENARRYPKSAEALSTYGWVLYKNTRLQDAGKVLNQVASAGNMSADTAYYIAHVMAESNTENAKAGAIQLLESAVKSTKPFSKRDEAKKLLAELKRAS
ncbi:MAG: hypothetical protein HQ567_25885 [Candidatus Nealsonbacteria bacterium]|nr:hypothetical protein [Candidatus Nealsonbacteria bacterium]